MIFKCKMCGGDVTPIKNSNIGKCEYCKSTMTLPNMEDEKIINLYNRANDYRINNEFDKASNVYDSILNIDNNQIEAHFGKLLCKYGIEYVDDPKTGKKVPTCHRTIPSSILVDPEYKFILKNSYGDALELYKNDALYIDNVQKEILSISSKEKPYDVFICYKETDDIGERSNDSVIAQDIYDKLVEQNYKVFFARITLEDKLGSQYEPYIYSALRSSKVMLVVGTKEEYFNAPWVKNEWSRFLEMMKEDKSKILIPVFSKMDAYKLPEEFSMLQAQSMDKVGALQDLTRGVKKLIDEYKTEEVDGIDKETVAKVKSVLDEVRTIGNGMYEVGVVKEKLPTWYYIICLVSIPFLGMYELGISSSSMIMNVRTVCYINLKEHSIILLGFECIYALCLILYTAFLFIKRKTHKLAKKLFPILMFLTLLRLPLFLLAGGIPRIFYGFLAFFLVQIVYLIISYIIVPKWTIDTSSKTILNTNEKELQLEKNKFIKNNFKVKEKNKDNFLKKLYIFILVGILGIISIISLVREYKYLPFKQSNGINTNNNQIVLIGSKKLYKSKSKDGSIITTLRAYDYYDIDVNELTVNKYKNPYGYIKITTNKGLTGYLYLGENDEYTNKDFEIICAEDNDECNNKFTYGNKRDKSVRQVKITNEQLNLREDHSVQSEEMIILYQEQIYTILDEYQENIMKKVWNDNLYSDDYGFVDVLDEIRTWYKIRTTNGFEGWICKNANGETYLEVLEKEV